MRTKKRKWAIGSAFATIAVATAGVLLTFGIPQGGCGGGGGPALDVTEGDGANSLTQQVGNYVVSSKRFEDGSFLTQLMDDNQVTVLATMDYSAETFEAELTADLGREELGPYTGPVLLEGRDEILNDPDRNLQFMNAVIIDAWHLLLNNEDPGQVEYEKYPVSGDCTIYCSGWWWWRDCWLDCGTPHG